VYDLARRRHSFITCFVSKEISTPQSAFRSPRGTFGLGNILGQAVASRLNTLNIINTTNTHGTAVVCPSSNCLNFTQEQSMTGDSKL